MKDTTVKLDELKDYDMYVLVAPDGAPQVMTLAPDFAMCCASIELQASYGVCQPLGALFDQGFSILPVKVTMVQNGTEEEGFQKAKKSMKMK